MELRLEKIEKNGISTLNHLVELASYDLSEWSGRNINENGLFVDNFNSQIWFEDDNFKPFYIRVDGNLAGFVIIRRMEEQLMYLNHFFVLRKYRRQSIGRQAVIQAFDRYPGQWRVNQFDWNIPAQNFWRRVIKDYTNDNYTETRNNDNNRISQQFISIHK
jgi:predicted acetyltransferase